MIDTNNTQQQAQQAPTEPAESSTDVPGVVAGAGLLVPVGDMFGLWKLSRRKREARKQEELTSQW